MIVLLNILNLLCFLIIYKGKSLILDSIYQEYSDFFFLFLFYIIVLLLNLFILYKYTKDLILIEYCVLLAILIWVFFLGICPNFIIESIKRDFFFFMHLKYINLSFFSFMKKKKKLSTTPYNNNISIFKKKWYYKFLSRIYLFFDPILLFFMHVFDGLINLLNILFTNTENSLKWIMSKLEFIQNLYHHNKKLIWINYILSFFLSFFFINYSLIFVVFCLLLNIIYLLLTLIVSLLSILSFCYYSIISSNTKVILFKSIKIILFIVFISVILYIHLYHYNINFLSSLFTWIINRKYKKSLFLFLYLSYLFYIYFNIHRDKIIIKKKIT